jgi:hypothetical protein
MIKGTKPVPDATDVDKIDEKRKDILLQSGNVVAKGDEFVFVAQNLVGSVRLKLFDSKGNVVYDVVEKERHLVATLQLSQGVYFYMGTDEDGYRKVGKLLVKSN